MRTRISAFWSPATPAPLRSPRDASCRRDNFRIRAMIGTDAAGGPYASRVWKGQPMASGQVVLVVDLGSSWCKAALIDAEGQVISTGEEWVREERIFGHDAAALERIW